MVCCCTNHPTCPPVKQRPMKGCLQLRNQATLHVLYASQCDLYYTVLKDALSSKQVLRDSSGSPKERTEEPLGNLKKVYRAHFAWPTL